MLSIINLVCEHPQDWDLRPLPDNAHGVDFALQLRPSLVAPGVCQTEF